MAYYPIDSSEWLIRFKMNSHYIHYQKGGTDNISVPPIIQKTKLFGRRQSCRNHFHLVNTEFGSHQSGDLL